MVVVVVDVVVVVVVVVVDVIVVVDDVVVVVVVMVVVVVEVVNIVVVVKAGVVTTGFPLVEIAWVGFSDSFFLVFLLFSGDSSYVKTLSTKPLTTCSICLIPLSV